VKECKDKVKVTIVQALRLCTGCTVHRGSRGIALLFMTNGTGRGWGVSFTPQLLFTPGKDQVPIVQEAGWAPGPVSTGAENLAPTGIRSLDRPARSQSLYWLRYPAHSVTHNISMNKQDKLLKQIYALRLDDFTAVTVQILVLCVMTQCSHVDGHQYFRKSCCLRAEVPRWSLKQR
jgi:hypothetical protein